MDLKVLVGHTYKGGAALSEAEREFIQVVFWIYVVKDVTFEPSIALGCLQVPYGISQGFAGIRTDLNKQALASGGASNWQSENTSA